MGKHKKKMASKRIPTGKVYTFETVKDIATQLTDNQIDDFVIDFAAFLHAVKSGKTGNKELDDLMGTMQTFMGAFAKLTGETIPDEFTGMIDPSRFKWIDDGAHEKVSRMTVVAVDPITQKREEVITFKTKSA